MFVYITCYGFGSAEEIPLVVWLLNQSEGVRNTPRVDDSAYLLTRLEVIQIVYSVVWHRFTSY